MSILKYSSFDWDKGRMKFVEVDVRGRSGSTGGGKLSPDKQRDKLSPTSRQSGLGVFATKDAYKNEVKSVKNNLT